jgi:hypothetical protein
LEHREGIAYVEAELLLSADANEEAAIAWARHRAPTVVLRRHRIVHAWRYRYVGGRWVRLRAPVEGSYEFFSAGEVDAGPGDEEEPVHQWPGAPLRREPQTHPRYGGTVHLASELEAGRPRTDVRYSAAWEAVRDANVVTVERFGPARSEEAIAWGCERAPIVLVCDHTFENAYWSAGDVDIPELDLPRWGEIDPATRRGTPGGTWTAAQRDRRRFPIGRPDPGTEGWLS